jgi:hypothetical protein
MLSFRADARRWMNYTGRPGALNECGRWWGYVMVRLDRTIGFSKLVPTGVVRLMIRSSRTMTMKGGQHATRQARMRSGPGMTD